MSYMKQELLILRKHGVTRRVSYMKQELFTFRKHMSSPRLFGGSVLLIVFSFLCCVFVLFYSRVVSCAQNDVVCTKIDSCVSITRVYR